MRLRAASLLLCVLCVCASCGERGIPSVEVGSPFPQLALSMLSDGAPANLVEHRGKPLLINFWATWCEPCRREMPALEKLAATMPGVTVVGVTVDTDVNLAREFVLKHGLTFARYADPDMAHTRFALSAGTLPITYLVAPDGRLLARYTGARDWVADSVKRELQAALR